MISWSQAKTRKSHPSYKSAGSTHIGFGPSLFVFGLSFWEAWPSWIYLWSHVSPTWSLALIQCRSREQFQEALRPWLDPRSWLLQNFHFPGYPVVMRDSHSDVWCMWIFWSSISTMLGVWWVFGLAKTEASWVMWSENTSASCWVSCLGFLA